MTKAVISNKNVWVKTKQKKKTSASLKRRKWGLGLPFHIQMTFIIINIPCLAINVHQYTLLVLNEILHIEYNALAIVPSWAEQLVSLLCHTMFIKATQGMSGTLIFWRSLAKPKVVARTAFKSSRQVPIEK